MSGSQHVINHLMYYMLTKVFVFYGKETLMLCLSVCIMLIPVAAQSKAWAFSQALARIAGSNPTRGMDVCLL
jgi:hypothetical protein